MIIMNFTRLESILCDTVKEEQIKLGYEEETIRLYYPMISLANILEENIPDTIWMDEVLEQFAGTVEKRLGKLRISHSGDRYCILIPPEGSAYVHKFCNSNPFLEDFIGVIRRHDCTLEQLLAVFRKYSDQIVCEKSAVDEFDYVLYFRDGESDDYRYCVKFEGGHTTYHRFLKRDYEDLLMS